MIPAGVGSIAFFLLAGLAAALIGAQRWSVRAKRPEAGTGALILWCGAVVMVTNALHLVVPDVQAKLHFARAQAGGVFPVPMLWFYLTMQFTGSTQWMTRKRVILLCVPVAAILLLLLTDPLHHLMILPGWSLPEGDLQRLSFSYGLPVWIYAVLGHSQVVVGSSFLALHMIRRPGFRWQGTVLLSAASLCVLANIADLTTSGTRPSFDLTPLALLVAVPCFVFALVRLQRADLVPIAHSSVIETMHDGLLVVDSRNRVLDLNPAAGAILGAEPGLVRGRELTSFWPDWPEKQGGLSATTRPTGEVSFPHRGSGREYEVTMSRLRDWRGQVTGQVLVFHDVTARRHAEEALRESERRLRTAFESTLVGVYQLAPDGRVLFANRAMARILGFDTSGEFSRRGPDHAAAILAATLRSGASPGDEVRGRLFSWRLPNGATLQLRENARRVCGGAGETAYFEGTVEDVTELVEARDALQRKAAYLQALNRIITAGAAAHDISQILDAALPCTLEALGLTSGAIWTQYHERSHNLPDGVQAALAGLGSSPYKRLEVPDALQTLPDTPVQDLRDLLAAAGVRALLAYPVLPGGWRAGGLAVLTREVHVWRQEEMSFVEAVANEVGNELHRLQMVEQSHHQERLAAVGQLAAGIAHDFNNFLATIVLQTEMLGADPALPASSLARTRVILDQSRRAADLTSQVLDFSRRSILEMQPLNLASLVEEQARLLERTLPENIRRVLSKDRGEFVIRGDRTRMQQVLLNLATNARDAMPGGGELGFSLRRMALAPGAPPPVAGMGDGAWVVLEVKDTGSGMTEEVRSHIFEPFFTTKAPGKGTGLGLSQVYGIVKQHEGFLHVSSAVRVGTVFRLYFPALAGTAPVDEEAQDAIRPGSGETILLVEDDDATRESLTEVLEKLGYQAVAARNGREALDLYDAHAGRIQLVISDVVMPELGGESLYVELMRRRPGLRMILVSGYPIGTTGRLLDPAGVIRLKKPLQARELASAIRKALDQRPQVAARQRWD